jgi:hypothetical protein
MVLAGVGSLLCIYKRHLESCDKETAGRSLPGNWGMVLPFRPDAIDQVWPVNFGGADKARLGTCSVAHTSVYRTTMSDYLQRGFYCFNGVLF